MDSNTESDCDQFDEEIDDTKHEKIVENVLNLNKVQHLKKPSRTEPSLQISEFNLVKSINGKKGSIELGDLTKALKKQKKHVELTKKIESGQKKVRTLPKPLEKPQVERIKRSVGYEKSRLQLDKWEGFVTSNRSLAHQVFPLGSTEKVKVEEKESKNFPQTWRIKSDIQKELEKLEPNVEEYHIEDAEKNEFSLTLAELKEQRKELAKLRAHQSFKEAKARRQNKIKSKKYHRILRREKIKKKLKEFDELQKTNPEEALKKLEEIERARALERYSLRHKGTGQWAKSKQFRAKYDKESRQVLAQQLAIGRDLTQKLKSQSDSEDEIAEPDENSLPNDTNQDNPWINAPKLDKEVAEFYSNYKKFWTDQNSKLKKDENNDSTKKITHETDKNTQSESKDKNMEVEVTEKSNKISQSKKSEEKDKRHQNKKLDKSTKQKTILNSSSGEWDIEQIFDIAEDKLAQKVRNKMKSVKQGTKSTTNKLNKKPKSKKMKTKTDLSMPSQSKRHVIDEEMIELVGHKEKDQNELTNIGILKNVLKSATEKESTEDIIPDNFPKPKTVELDSANPDLLVEDDNTDEASQEKVIIEAFEDDAIDEDFDKEKAEEVDKDTPKDIDLNLPGWGSWAGAMIDPKKQRKRKRFIIKMPEKLPRRDDNKGSLIINEKAQAKIKSHLVAEVPFPFKTVKDFEASIRAPIGNTFVPETAFRKLIKPAVETKMGAIITPVTKSILIGKKKT